MDYLWRTWQHVLKRFKVAKSGTDLYSDADFWFRLVRDYAHRNVEEIIVDSDMGESRLLDLLGHGPTSQQIKVTRHRDSTPIFKANHIEPQLEDLISRDINLPSGGSIRIDHTEALTVFDVNSAHYTGKSNKLEDLAFTVNKEAAKEICRQLRLRDMGGIIVVDFIDMGNSENRRILFDHLRNEMAEDRAKHKILPPSKFGLIQITRQRVRQELNIKTKEENPSKEGEIEAPIVLVDKINIELESIIKEDAYKGRIVLNAHPFIAAYLTKGFLNSIRFKWFLKYKRWIKILPRDAYSYLEYRFKTNEGTPL